MDPHVGGRGPERLAAAGGGATAPRGLGSESLPPAGAAPGQGGYGCRRRRSELPVRVRRGEWIPIGRMPFCRKAGDRKRRGEGQRVYVRVELGGRRIIKKKK